MYADRVLSRFTQPVGVNFLHIVQSFLMNLFEILRLKRNYRNLLADNNSIAIRNESANLKSENTYQVSNFCSVPD